MKCLAIYGLIVATLSLIFTIGDNKNTRGWRIFGIVIYLPPLIFFLYYLHIV